MTVQEKRAKIARIKAKIAEARKKTLKVREEELTDDELAELEQLMVAEKKLAKAGKRLAVRERVRKARLASKLRAFVEEYEGDTFPNEDDNGWMDDIDPEGKTGTGGDRVEADLVEKRKRAARIKAIKERIARKRRKRVKEDEFADEGFEDDGFEDDGFEGEAEADGLSMNIEFPPGYELPDTSEMQADIEPLMLDGGDEVDEVLESVRVRARKRRERLAKIRRNRMKENDPAADTPPMDGMNAEAILGELYDELGGDEDAITEAIKRIARKRRIEKIRRQREREVKVFGDGSREGNPDKKFTPEKPKKFPESVQNKMSEAKLDFDALLKKGILG